MAVRLIDDAPTDPGLPLAPNRYPAVLAAREVRDRAASEVARCTELVATAEAALTTSQASAAEAALRALEQGLDIPGDDPALIEAVAVAGRQLALAQQTQALAARRYQQVLADARAEFAAAVRPMLIDQLADVTAIVLEAIAANDELRRLAAYASENGDSLPAAYELALPLLRRDRIEALIAERGQMFSVSPSGPPPGKAAVRWLANVVPYAEGEVAGVDEDEAVIQIRAGFAEFVDQTQAKRLGLDNLVKFDGPIFLELIKDFTPAWGVVTPKGTRLEYDPITAARLVNLGYAKVL